MALRERIEKMAIEQHGGAFTYSQDKEYFKRMSPHYTELFERMERIRLFPFMGINDHNGTSQIKFIATKKDGMDFLNAFSITSECVNESIFIKYTDLVTSIKSNTETTLEKYSWNNLENIKKYGLCTNENLPKDLNDLIANFESGYSKDLLMKLAERNEVLGDKYSLDIVTISITYISYVFGLTIEQRIKAFTSVFDKILDNYYSKF